MTAPTPPEVPIPAAVAAAYVPPLAPPLAPTTTFQEDVTTASQRKINLIWEYTQAFIAITVVLANMIAAVYNVFKGSAVDVPMILSSALFLIVGFYFSRTNHQAVGGVGPKPADNQPYEGR